jgi:hypothetical protein
MRKLRQLSLAALALAASTVHAEKIDAGSWAVNAEAVDRGKVVKVSGAVSGPACKLLRLDIFTHDDQGSRGHIIATIKDVGSSRKFFEGSDSTWGGGSHPQISSAFASCMSK